MKGLISKEAVKKEIMASWSIWNDENFILRRIDSIPVIDATPIVHGQWTPSNEYKGFVECSECHDTFVYTEWITSGKWSFCPNCGAKMEEDI